MNHLIRNSLLSLAIGATALASATPTLADGWRRPYYYGPPPVERRHHGGDAAALGVIGLATGLIVGSAIAGSHQNDAPVYEPYPVDPYRRPPAPAPFYDTDRGYYPATPRRVAVPDYRVQTLEPWTPAWQDYCANRYRSFDPASGTYAGYDGNRHFCTAG